MKKPFVLIVAALMAGAFSVKAQVVLTLQECYEKAIAHTPLSAEQQALTEIWYIKDRNLTAGWYPNIDAGGSFVYNTSVVDLSSTLDALPVPGIADRLDPLPHEQYKVTLDVSQMILDGGAVKSARALERADLQVSGKQLDVELYRLRTQISQYYFTLLLLQRQEELLKIHLNLINRRIQSAALGMKEGMVMETDMNILRCEQVKLQQQIQECKIDRAATLRMLSDITGIPVDTSTVVSFPEFSIAGNRELTRPELELFDLKQQQLNASLDMIRSKRMPKAYLFATAGMGNPPGSDFFRDEFAPYGVAGAGIKWNVFDWKKAEHEKRGILLQKEILEGRKNDLAGTLLRQLEAKHAEIEKFEALLKTDDELILLRSRIVAAATSQYDNGILTVSEYLKELTAEREAWISNEIHRIGLARAKSEYLNIAGYNYRHPVPQENK